MGPLPKLPCLAVGSAVGVALARRGPWAWRAGRTAASAREERRRPTVVHADHACGRIRRPSHHTRGST
eukprot:5309818-Prymnesium_polylepis.2